jgi:hypothetical protein
MRVVLHPLKLLTTQHAIKLGIRRPIHMNGQELWTSSTIFANTNNTRCINLPPQPPRRIVTGHRSLPLAQEFAATSTCYSLQESMLPVH